MRARDLIAIAFLASSALAQRPVFDPDDFVDPAINAGPLFLSRVVAGVVWNPEDRFRSIHGDAGFVILTNSLYVGGFQFDYKHREAAGDDPPPLTRCDCPDPVYFPTPPPGDAMPAGPQPGRSDTLQFAVYRTSNAITLRYGLAFTRQQLDTTVTSARTGEVLEQRSGHDQSLTVNADTHFRILGRSVWGTFYFARASRSGVPDKRAQNEFGYVWRPAGRSAKEVLWRFKLTVGGISGRGATSINLVNPYFEALWRHRDTKINFHLVLSPQAMRDGDGWHTNNEIAVFADYTLFVHMFRPTR